MPRIITLALLPIALLSGITAPAQPINWDSVRADYITKYQPQQVPAWLFPIIFEEGGGQRDTIYLGYDLDALPNFGETWFGEIFQPVDTSRFNASICLGFSFDSIYKVSISPLQNTSQCGDAIFSISFYKSTFHLKMYWDRAAFYSDSLPFYRDSINYPPNLPKAMGEIWCSNLDPYYDNCMIAANFPPFVLPADPNGYFTGTHDPDCYFIEPDLTQPGYAGASPCIASDSIVIFGDTTAGTASTPDWMPLTFVIRQYKKPVGIKEAAGNGHVSVYPNPFTDYASLTIKGSNSGNQACTLQIFDIHGRQVRQTEFTGPTTLIRRNGLPGGVYFYMLTNRESSLSTGKFIIH